MGILKGFINRALNICSNIHIEDELKFLTEIFIENGYKSSEVTRTIAEVRKKRAINAETRTRTDNESSVNNNTSLTTITLPWIPGVSPKLRKAYKKAGYRTIFKSNINLKNILCSKNKTRLPPNSYPGVYKVVCRCDAPYTGETKLKICTRGQQHQKNVRQNIIDNSGIVNHSRKCNKGIDWEEMRTLKIESNRFERKVREALEIQYHECGPKKGGMNLDDGQYVKTKFWTPFFRFLRKKQGFAHIAHIATSNNAADTTLPGNGI